MNLDFNNNARKQVSLTSIDFPSLLRLLVLLLDRLSVIPTRILSRFRPAIASIDIAISVEELTWAQLLTLPFQTAMYKMAPQQPAQPETRTVTYGRSHTLQTISVTPLNRNPDGYWVMYGNPTTALNKPSYKA